MKLLILKENLTKALSIVSKGLSTKPQLPILSHLLLKARNNQLELYATNLEVGIVFQTPAKVEKEGEVAVPGKLLIEFVSSLTTDKIELSANEKSLTVKTDKTKGTLSIGNPQDFPPFPQIEKVNHKLPLAKISSAILRTVFSASLDEGRPILTGVKTSLLKDKLLLSATDGYRLSKEEVDLGSDSEPLDVILPASSLSETVRIAESLEAKEIDLMILENKNQVVFGLPNARIFTRLIDGEFPNVEKIIPVGFKTRVIVNRDTLHSAVKTTSIFARGSANIIKIKVEKSGIRLSANTPSVGEEEDYIDAEVDGEELEIAFNFRFLLDLLNNFPDKELVFESLGSLNPGVFKPKKSSPSFLHIIMPVRVQS